jgi:hypothetical protein
MLHLAEVVPKSNLNPEERTFETRTPKLWKMLHSAEVVPQSNSIPEERTFKNPNP